MHKLDGGGMRWVWLSGGMKGCFVFVMLCVKLGVCDVVCEGVCDGVDGGVSGAEGSGKV